MPRANEADTHGISFKDPLHFIQSMGCFTSFGLRINLLVEQKKWRKLAGSSEQKRPKKRFSDFAFQVSASGAIFCFIVYYV
ncbi:hypothetical protein JCM10512_5035 [Bacteroides reticulotermitis JCM 10512]|uniref:Uncharacterized protein n=2 Tax=Bacteroides reticulotermitis TaxID=1133319 RepID=W4V144_9BACE|nr:hypothetical protein JCM10512_5035 [Bacteroides reticulotermitis JCM 10512]